MNKEGLIGVALMFTGGSFLTIASTSMLIKDGYSVLWWCGLVFGLVLIYAACAALSWGLDLDLQLLWRLWGTSIAWGSLYLFLGFLAVLIAGVFGPLYVTWKLLEYFSGTSSQRRITPVLDEHWYE